MVETADQLATVRLKGRLVSFSHGGRLVGDVVTELAAANGERLPLTGVGLLRLEGSPRAA